MAIKMTIHNIKSVNDFVFEIPTQKGLYAITGENGSGKSTIMSCAATAFYKPILLSYFGYPFEGSKIEFEYEEKTRRVLSAGKRWLDPVGSLGITGFYEGSIVFGNRFKDIDFRFLQKLNKVNPEKLSEASSFIKENLGRILHDDTSYYDCLFILDADTDGLNLHRPSFYLKISDRYINQLNMSTGENLLLTILYSLENRLNRKNYGPNPMLILLDEIELALHSSALRRLVVFLREISDSDNIVILFSTHSIELIRSINPANIYYLQRFIDNSLDVVNPCYPVYATRNLESSNYGHDFIIMVEDDLAKNLVDIILDQNRLRGNKRILTIAVGGWHQVLRFAYDTIRSNLMLKTSKILIILDRDIKDDVPSFMKEQRIGFSVEPSYLPVESLEKYLLKNLVIKVDHSLYKDLDDYIFQGTSLQDIILQYSTQVKNGIINDKEKIKNGKAFYGIIRHELQQIRKDENDLSQRVVKYLLDQNTSEIQELTSFLNKELALSE